jgi:hypothetical protein
MVHDWEISLIKDHMARKVGFVGDMVETLVASILVTKENVWLRAVFKLVMAIGMQ